MTNVCRRLWRITPLLAACLCYAQVPSGYTISTVAGNGTTGFSGDGGSPTDAQLGGPFSVAMDSAGRLLIADQFNHRIRQLPPGSTISTVAGNGTAGYSGDGATATSANLHDPTGIAVDSSGNLYIADSQNHVVRKVTSSGTISTFAGSNTLGAGLAGDGGAASSAQLNLPLGVAVDAAGNVYIADTNNNRIRKVTTDGKISTVFSGLAGPRSVAVDSSSQLYIAETLGNRVSKIDAKGQYSTIAGTGDAGYSGDGGMAVNAMLREPYGVAVDAAGAVYIADYGNSRIRKVGLNQGITTIAGNGIFGWAGDGGPATAADLRFPSGLALDKSGDVYVADLQNNLIRMLTPMANDGGATVIQEQGVITAAAFGGFHTIAPGSWIEIYGSNLGPAAKAWGSADFRGTLAPTWLSGTSVTVAGQPAYISYVSGGQLNVEVPSNVLPGAQDLVVTTDTGVSQTYSVNVAAAMPGLYSPPQLLIEGKQFAGAFFPDGSAVLPSRPAKPGQTITLYGTGFGKVNPDIPAGQIVSTANSLAARLEVRIGDQPATVGYAGLAPGAVGLYQFNVVVPDVSGAVPLTFSLGGTAGQQTLYVAVQ